MKATPIVAPGGAPVACNAGNISPLTPQGVVGVTKLLIEGNGPGEVCVSSREDLRRYVLSQATTIASLSVCLTYLINTAAGPDGGFVSDYAEHLNNLIFQQENAVKLLLGDGGEV